MIVRLYEWIIKEDGTRAPGRGIGVITFPDDGTPGKIYYNNNCNNFLDVRDVNHPCYGDKIVILDEIHKKILFRMLNEPIYITTDGGWDGETHYTSGRTLKPWYRETLEYILEYELASSPCTTICGDFPGIVYIELRETLIKEDGTKTLGRLAGCINWLRNGMPRKIYFDSKVCDEIWDVRDINHPCYKNKKLIFDKSDKEKLMKLVTQPVYITQEKKYGQVRHYPEGKIINPWTYESFAYLIDTAGPDSFESITLKFNSAHAASIMDGIAESANIKIYSI